MGGGNALDEPLDLPGPALDLSEGDELVAEQKPPIQWKMTPRSGFGPKAPRSINDRVRIAYES
jgi:hypothetical protein